MERRELVITAILSTLAVLLALALGLYVFFWCHRRRRKLLANASASGNGDPEAAAPTGRAANTDEHRTFLSLRTPLISTRTFGCDIVHNYYEDSELRT
ncbi:hypothetical protein LSTR_LSTR014607 [Laodelphax striatellus]|uniref:Uncharacterized protein n=1 Tax=Laodelphax striatellus TaxID=195883 RepID=A0A482XI34_LAOST|nr:hypothetical protein LSTR_LSTR014607 [Laodelphax striatellus]